MPIRTAQVWYYTCRWCDLRPRTFHSEGLAEEFEAEHEATCEQRVQAED
jgi:hypothetical protein